MLLRTSGIVLALLYAFTLSGAAGKAFEFDNNDDYLSISYTAGSMSFPAMTVEGWYKPRSLPRNSKDEHLIYTEDGLLTLELQGDNSNIKFYSFVRYISGASTGSFEMQVNVPRSQLENLASSDGWLHFAVSTTSGHSFITVYFVDPSNGQPRTYTSPVNTTTYTTLNNNATVFTLGGRPSSHPNNRPVDGMLDEFRVWTSGRTTAQIAATRSCTGSAYCLDDYLIYYDFNESDLPQVPNRSSNLFYASLHNISGSPWKTSEAPVVNCNPPAVELKTNKNHKLTDGDTRLIPGETIISGMAPGESGSFQFQIKNVGNSTLNIQSITSDHPRFVVSDVPASIAAGGKVNFTITYTSDLAANAHTATIRINHGGCAGNNPFTFRVQGKADRRGRALNFDGTNDMVQYQHGAGITGSFTLEMWIRPEGSQQANLLRDGANQFRLYLDNASGFKVKATAGMHTLSATIPDTGWTHVAFVHSFEHLFMKLVVNGEVRQEIHGQATVVNLPDNHLHIGGYFNSSDVVEQPFDGSMDDLRIWSVARTDSQLYNGRSCRPGSCETGLLHYFSFDQGVDQGDNFKIKKVVNEITGKDAKMRHFAGTGPSSNWVYATNIKQACAGSSEIRVSGNYQVINDGRSITSADDGTYFGLLDALDEPVIRTFWIENVGSNPLTINAVTIGDLTGAFVILDDIGGTELQGNGGAVSFRVKVNPLSLIGLSLQTIRIFSNASCDKSMYSSEYNYKVGAESSSALPLTWLEFRALPEPERVVLQWKTADEYEVSGFFAERSTDGEQWEELFFVPASDGRGQQKQYEQYDTDPRPGRSYYRLRQVDNDGRYSYSPVRTVEWNGHRAQCRVYPNPTRGELTLEGVTGGGRYHLVNARGQQLLSRTLPVQETPILITLPAGLPAGIYYLQIQAPDRICTERIVKE